MSEFLSLGGDLGKDSLNQLKRTRWPLVNCCYLRKNEEEPANHTPIPYGKARV